MYNKLFSKIVDSSIWMEPDHVRLIWMMFIAIMDEDGFVNLASIKNVAHRAVMDVKKAKAAIEILEGPDPESSNPANDGRRLTRVPGGWIVNNSKEYRDIVKREHQKELNRERVKKHRQRKSPASCNGDVMVANETVTPSEAEAEAEAEENTNTTSAKRGQVYDSDFETFWSSFPKARRTKKQEAYRRWKSALKRTDAEVLIKKAAEYAASPKGQSEFAVMPSVWLNSGMWEDSPESWGDQNTKTTNPKPNPKTQVLNPRVDCAETGGEYVPGYPYKWMD